MTSFELIKSYIAPRRRTIVLGLCCLVLVDVLQLIVPRVIKQAVDDLALMQATPASLVMDAGLIVAIGLLVGLFRYVWRRCLLGTARHVERDLRNRLLDHLQQLSGAWFDAVRTGDLMAHATNDIQQIRMATGMGMVAFNDAVVLGTAAIGFMLYIHVPLTVYVLLPMPLIVLSTRLLGRQMHRRYQRVQASFAELTESVRERFAGIRLVKAHNAEAVAAEQVRAASRAYVTENLKLIRVTGAFFPLMLLLTNVSLAAVLYLGGRRVIASEITPGDFVAFISYLGLLTWPMMALGWVTNLIQRGRASLDRIQRILNQRPDIDSRPGARGLTQTTGAIAFDHVRFGYRGADTPVLDDIDLALSPGQILGIVGPPGSGKTTLLRLVARLYDPTDGAVRIDGHDLRDVRLPDLRRQMAMVAQEPFLFSGTLSDNLLFGNSNIDAGRVKAAIAAASLDKTVDNLPSGLDTLVGENGVILSGGQKQRVALARAFLKPAVVWLFDDPVSQVDAHTAQRIIDGIRQRAGHKTVIMVSHRLAAVHFADQIISLDQGRVAEHGTHEQLMAAGGYYARTFRLQELSDEI